MPAPGRSRLVRGFCVCRMISLDTSVRSMGVLFTGAQNIESTSAAAQSSGSITALFFFQFSFFFIEIYPRYKCHALMIRRRHPPKFQNAQTVQWRLDHVHEYFRVGRANQKLFPRSFLMQGHERSPSYDTPYTIQPSSARCLSIDFGGNHLYPRPSGKDHCSCHPRHHLYESSDHRKSGDSTKHEITTLLA